MRCLSPGVASQAVLVALAVLLSLCVVDARATGSICWSGEQNVVLGLVPGMNMTCFDLNGDGIDDFGLRNYEATLSFVPLGDNAGMATTAAGYDWFGPLPPDTAVGQLPPSPYLWMTEEAYLVSYMVHDPTGQVIGIGPWHGVEYGLLGLSFEINGRRHYGWIRMSDVSEVTFMVHDWAYESGPGVAIKAGAGPGLMAAPEVVRPGYLRLKWRREVGKSYRVQATTRLDAPTWTSVFLFGVWITPTEMAVEVRMEGAAQFFRVIEAD